MVFLISLSVCLAIVAMFLWIVGIDDARVTKWAKIMIAVVFVLVVYIVVKSNIKDCGDYEIYDYQMGHVPVACVGTYNTVPKD